MKLKIGIQFYHIKDHHNDYNLDKYLKQILNTILTVAINGNFETTELIEY